ncbi:beta-lactamase superfamily II metal-dependent hydrolase [Salsuginibacillus halophilus]|uniref:Beta-lactamase superfamily II metal-dependent hydrolase n=1 Tax=Salsuginibacillus halophilus TaxID=517424 RepID=A0A2P8HWI2_9BACI|nr:hypothetical protein [Salsuginibacillus halophilus]PSL50534.1 beta-lactamase superfamily II metal-dependent hydrolase [Salsuginibacillus halophilus]
MRACVWFIGLILLVSCGDEAVQQAGLEQVTLQVQLEEGEHLVSFFDLPDGEATLFTGADHRHVLINTGGPASWPALEHQLEVFNVEEIDHLIITHPGEAYASGVEQVVEQYHVKEIAAAGGMIERLKAGSFGEELHLVEVENGDEWPLFPDLQAEVLFAGKEGVVKDTLVIAFQAGGQQLLYMGTADAEVEKQLAKSMNLKSTLLKVGDFGTPFGAWPPFLEKVDPQVAVVFLQKDHKADEALLERLEDHWVDIRQAGREGVVSFKWKGTSYESFTLPPVETAQSS